jgi:hypothetical protein
VVAGNCQFSQIFAVLYCPRFPIAFGTVLAFGIAADLLHVLIDRHYKANTTITRTIHIRFSQR